MCKRPGAPARQYIKYMLPPLRLRLARSRRFLTFLAVGLSGLVVDMTILYLLTDIQTLHWPLTRSKILAAEVAIINNFLWNDRWTFGDMAAQQRGRRQKLRRFTKFNLVCLIGVGINVLILSCLLSFKFIQLFLKISV